MTKMITHVSFFVCLLCVALVNAKSNRIIGGVYAVPGQFKYQVYLYDDMNRMCGAAILADQYVLTAAHCLIDNLGIFYSSRFHVIAGSIDVHTNQGVRVDVEKIYVPREYRARDKKNDIAVLKLRRRLGLGSNPNLQKINLPPSREPSYVGQTATITGYGWIHVALAMNPITHELEEVNGYTDGKLKYATANVISNDECARKNKYPTDEKQICGQAVQHRGKYTGICSGDSGGPLIIGNVIIGVASKSPKGCVEDSKVAVYTRVSSFIGFITKAMTDTKTSDMVVREIPSSESSSNWKRHEASIWVDSPFFCN